MLPRPIAVPRPTPRDPPPPQALTPRASDCRPDFARPSGPLSRHRERGWGERANALRLPWERFCAQYGLIFGSRRKINPYPAQPATGVLGQRPKRVLLTFARTKVSPRRVGVLTKPFIRLAPPKVTTIFFTNTPPAGVQIRTLYKSCPADRRYPAIT